MGFLLPRERAYLLLKAEESWNEAENLSPGSTLYARARWAAWSGDIPLLINNLAHPAFSEDNFDWPSFEEACFDPAFSFYKNESWFKAAWFGYSQRLQPRLEKLP
jgi:hypothetical protein